MKNSHIAKSLQTAVATSLVLLLSASALYMLVEPQITHGQSSTFLVRTTITGENSFLVPPSNANLTGTINGLTGGQATGASQFVVQSNSPTGYEVRIAFFNNGTDNAMRGDVSEDESIVDYLGDVAGEPSAGFTTNASAQFAYTVTSSSSPDTDQSFRVSAGTCNQSGGDQLGTCWKSPETSNFTIVSRNSPSLTGATSTISFNVTVPNNPVPTPTADGYTATATLSLIPL